MDYTFYGSAVETIDKLTVNEGIQYTATFGECYNLKNIVLGGTIGNNIDFQWSTKLTKVSITSIINALSATASGKTLTLSEAAVISAFGNLDDEWTTVMSGKDNWTICLV